MITYSLLVVAAIFVIVKWVFYHNCKKKAMTREQIDAALIGRLNMAEDAHAK